MGFNSGFKGLTLSGFSRLIFIKDPNTNVYGNPSSGSGADMCGQTDGHEKASRPFSRLYTVA